MVRCFTISLLLLLVSCHASDSNSPSSSVAQAEAASELQTESFKVQVMNLVNAYRDSKGVVRLIRTSALEEQIQTHMSDITERRMPFGHRGMNDRCRHARTELDSGNACGEIVAKGQKTPQAVFDAWIASPKHRERMIEGRYNRVGVGLAMNEDGHLYWGLLFLQK